MKLLTLNAWGGRVPALLDFLRENKDIDIFCFQEIYNGGSVHTQDGRPADGDIYDKISDILNEHVGYFRPHYRGNFGLASFIKKGLQVNKEEDIYVYKERGWESESHVGNHARITQLLSLMVGGKKLNIFNIHGVWQKGVGKTDNPDRIEQSNRLIAYMEKFGGAKILCGDFNLLPDTESVKMIEDSGLDNLITKHGITSTRTSYYEKEDQFADYIFINDGVKDLGFEAVQEEVSDHRALKLDFELR